MGFQLKMRNTSVIGAANNSVVSPPDFTHVAGLPRLRRFSGASGFPVTCGSVAMTLLRGCAVVGASLEKRAPTTALLLVRYCY